MFIQIHFKGEYKTVKKVLCIIIAAVVAVSIGACGKKTSEEAAGADSGERVIPGADKCFAVAECSDYILKRADFDSEGEYALQEHYTCTYEHKQDNVYERTKITDVKSGESTSETDTGEYTAETKAEEEHKTNYTDKNGKQYEYKYNDNDKLEQFRMISPEGYVMVEEDYTYEDGLLTKFVHHSYDKDGNEKPEYMVTHIYDGHDKFGNPTHAEYINEELTQKGYTSALIYEYDETGMFLVSESQEYYMTTEQFEQHEGYDEWYAQMNASPKMKAQYEKDVSDGIYTYQVIKNDYELDEYGNKLTDISTHMFYSELFSQYKKEYKYIELKK